MNRILSFLLMLLYCVNLSAQQKLTFSVLEFDQDVFDTSAKSAEYGKKDGNGSWYAIVKVTSNNPDDDITACQFNFGNMSSKVEKHDEALWVYVQRNAKKVTISRPGYHTISQYDLQTTLEAGAVYKMVLTSDRIEQRVVQNVTLQMVKFQTNPVVPGAMVMVTNQVTGQKESIGLTASNGAVSKALSFGKYSYEVLAPDNLYYPSEGLITLNSNKEVLTEQVTLRPHFAEITLVATDDAEIYINEDFKGKGKWEGKLSSGTYLVSCKKANHRDSQQQLLVEEGIPQNLTLPAPTPIVGTLVVNTTPTDASINIDGKDYGSSPQILNDVLIGNHEVTLSLGGYRTEKVCVIIEEGQASNVDIELQQGKDPSLSGSNKLFTINVNGVSFNMVKIEKGIFKMGSKEEKNERPIHQVTLTKDYYIGETEVTQKLWYAVMGESESQGKWDEKHGIGDDYPVYNVSYEDVKAFITKLNSLTDYGFRLPTEAEWEFAAKGGNESKGYKYSGSNSLGKVGWHDTKPSDLLLFAAGGLVATTIANKVSKKLSHPAKEKEANELGIYDMSGNVAEWCSDWFDAYPSSEQINPIGPTVGSQRVVRGGNAYEKDKSCRTAYRSSYTPSTRSEKIGFRLCL